jgi:hypothetical protein
MISGSYSVHRFCDLAYPLASGEILSGSTGFCADPIGISFSDAFELDDAHTGTCNVGLDFDDTKGFGHDHITELNIPPGNYVISLDSVYLNAPVIPTILYL